MEKTKRITSELPVKWHKKIEKLIDSGYWESKKDYIRQLVQTNLILDVAETRFDGRKRLVHYEKFQQMKLIDEDEKKLMKRMHIVENVLLEAGKEAGKDYTIMDLLNFASRGIALSATVNAELNLPDENGIIWT